MPRRPDLSPLWREYRAAPTVELRNRLVEANLSIVRRVAEAFHSRLPAEVELDDLISDGTLGLIGAVENFDPAVGVKFPTYASPRIRGAILDGLRELDWAPRLVRRRQTKVKALADKILRNTGVLPTDEEIRKELGAKTADDGRPRVVESLSGVITGNFGKDVRRSDLIPDRCPDAKQAVDNREAVNRMLVGLYPRHRLAVLLYTIAGMNMKETGRALGLSESRVSQMLAYEAYPAIRARYTYDQARDILCA